GSPGRTSRASSRVHGGWWSGAATRSRSASTPPGSRAKTAQPSTARCRAGSARTPRRVPEDLLTRDTLLAARGGQTFNQPFTGFYRIACNEPCHAELATGTRDGVVWNVSTLGLYLVLSPPLPETGETLRVTFRLTGDPAPIVAQCRVVWQNLPFMRGAGQKAPTLPP